MITKWPPERCGISYYSKDLCMALSKHINFGVMSSNEWRNNDPFLPFKILMKCRDFTIVHFQHEYLLYGHPYFMPIFLFTLAILRLRKIFYGTPLVVVTMHSTIKIEEMTRELWHRHRCLVFAFNVQRFLAISCMKILGHLTNMVIVHTNYAKDILVNQYGFSVNKVNVIPHGLWPKFAINNLTCNSVKNLLIFGFFRPTKNYAAVIRALKLLPKNIHLQIRGTMHPHYSDIGFASYKEVVELSKGLRLDDRIHIELGFIEKEKSFSDINVVILPYSELYGGSGALCDAIAFNKPIVAADIPHFRSLLQGYRWLTDINDAEKLAKNVVDLMDNYNDALTKINVYRDLWNWDRVAEITVKAYEETLLQTKE